jgi:signal peptidase I
MEPDTAESLPQPPAMEPPGETAAAEIAPPAPHVVPSERTSWLTSAQSLAVTVVIALFVITFIVQAFQIPSESMEDTLLIGDYLLVDKVHYGHGGIWGEILPYEGIHRGDIIVFRYPVHPAQHFVKRVIGIPGDRVHLVNKQVYVNDVPLREPYVVYKGLGPDAYRDDFPSPEMPSSNVDARWWIEMQRLVHGGELTVPANSYFVLGDNRDESLDSRYWGFVPRGNIIGRPLMIYWSVRAMRGNESAGGSDDKLSHFLYALTHVLQETRWDRTFRIVK